MSEPTIAALYVETGGAYFGLDGVDPWDVERDAPVPTRGGWSREMFGPGWVTEVSQSAYGHRARKRTWLYFVGPMPPRLDWRDESGEAWVSWGDYDRYPDRARLSKREAKATPPAFRELLIDLARGTKCEAA